MILVACQFYIKVFKLFPLSYIHLKKKKKKRPTLLVSIEQILTHLNY